MIPLRALHRIVTTPAAPVGPRTEAPAVCELCSAPIADEHRHVLELAESPAPPGPRRIACACGACAILFQHADGKTAHYRTVPTRVIADVRCTLSPNDLAQLGIPVGLVVVFTTECGTPVALYPGAAGIVDAELPPEAWTALRAATTVAAIAEPEVEAVLLHAERGAEQVACFLVPIDLAYDLAGRLRRTWRGFSGGEDARREIETFFAELRRRGRPRGAR